VCVEPRQDRIIAVALASSRHPRVRIVDVTEYNRLRGAGLSARRRDCAVGDDTVVIEGYDLCKDFERRGAVECEVGYRIRLDGQQVCPPPVQ
jgi:hypothetical protein